MLPAEPPRYLRWADLLAPIKRGETGWRAYALQAALRTAGRTIDPDGAFGDRTLRALKGFQQNNGLVPDGIAGPATQSVLLRKAERVVHPQIPDLPVGVLRGFAVAEGAGVLAATNWFTPTAGKPGVDCGPVQWRQHGPPFNVDDVAAAFDPESAFLFAGNTLLFRMQEYDRRRPALSSSMVLRLAVLAHNAPFMAEQVVRNGKLSTPNQLATWTVKPEGGSYTHAEWAVEYPSRILQFVQ